MKLMIILMHRAEFHFISFQFCEHDFECSYLKNVVYVQITVKILV